MASQIEDLSDVLEPRPADPEPGDDLRLLNRELSWLDFNARVLALTQDPEVPLLERAKFLAIFGQNLDEFFMVRVAGLKDQVVAGVTGTSPDGMNPADQLSAISERVAELVTAQARIFLEEVVPGLNDVGIRLSDWESLDDDDREHLVNVFEERIFPVLTPLAVDPGHPFPYISNLSLNLALIVSDPISGQRRFARVKVPPLLPRFIVMPDGERFVPLEQVIAAHLDVLFPGMDVECQFPFRVIRNADLTLEEEEADDLLAAVEMELRRRRFGKAVRLEIDHATSDEVEELLMRELELGPDDVYRVTGPLDLGGLWSVYELDRPELKDDSWTAITQPALARTDDTATDLFSVLRERDVLVHHPYDSFTTSVEAFIKTAAADKDVLAIKLTLYRTSGDSPIIKALIRAAERGKQVVALVELKARFDEQANIAWARALEEAGVHVVYGLVGLKTHSKTCLVVRQEDDGIRRYWHVGTGNYNPKTARVYEDVGLLSSAPEVGADLTDLFNFLTGYSRRTRYRKLLVAPASLRERIVGLIDEQARAGGRIVLKMNNLVDETVIDALYRASQAGAEIDLIVRGICCLRPCVPGLSDGVRVRSLVGRYLEHSRIFAFGDPASGPVRYFIGSADMMPRNLDGRVEVLVPIEDPELQGRLKEIIDVNLADRSQAWTLDARGEWHKLEAGDGLGAHRRLQQLALERGARRSSEPLVPVTGP